MFKKNSILILVFLILTFLIYNWIKTLPKVAYISDTKPEITVESGESIFWGKGRCHVCHRVGERGYALRGPDLGEGKEGPIIAIRAQERAARLGLTSATAYLVQSIAEPGAFVVPGYKNEMPEVFKAPISLTPAEIKAVICYLEDLGGVVKPADIHLPSKLLAAYKKPEETFKFQIKGNVEAGRTLFFDVEGPAGCAACHLGINAEGHANGSPLGPDLTAIASIRTPHFILNEILFPDSLIVHGYEEILLKTKDGRLITGIVKEEDNEKLVLFNKTDRQFVIRKNKIKSRIPQIVSMMPNNYRDLLSKKQLHDLLAYLLTLTGE